MRRKVVGRWGYQRTAAREVRRPAPTAAACECGLYLVNGRCLRCSALDGDHLSPSAAALLSEIRQLRSATWDVLGLEMPGYSMRQLHRAVRELLEDGYIARREARREVSRGDATVAEFIYIGTKAA